MRATQEFLKDFSRNRVEVIPGMEQILFTALTLISGLDREIKALEAKGEDCKELKLERTMLLAAVGR